MKKASCIYFVLISFTFACKLENVPKRKVVPAFYHWKTNLNFTEKTHLDLQKTGVKKLYVKFFDIDWSVSENLPVPKASVEITSDYVSNYEIIPSIFITNRTFLNISEKKTEQLAIDTAEKLKRDLKKFSIKRVFEIQFDCDWSGKTQKKFFLFLKKFKEYFGENIDLSATIRLHQIKYFKTTGVPPVSRGMLMFYNMSNVENRETENSILDLKEAEKYLINFHKYPLKLDLALPAYSWGVLFRDSEMIKLIPGIYMSDCQSFTKIHTNQFKIDSSGYFKGHYLYKNDRLRLEVIEPEDLLKAANLLSGLMKNPTLTVSFYHLHEHSFKRFTHEDYLEVLEKFKE